MSLGQKGTLLVFCEVKFDQSELVKWITYALSTCALKFYPIIPPVLGRRKRNLKLPSLACVDRGGSEEVVLAHCSLGHKREEKGGLWSGGKGKMDADMYVWGAGKLASFGAFVPWRAGVQRKLPLMLETESGVSSYGWRHVWYGGAENVCGELRVSGICFSISSTGEPR